MKNKKNPAPSGKPGKPLTQNEKKLLLTAYFHILEAGKAFEKYAESQIKREVGNG